MSSNDAPGAASVLQALPPWLAAYSPLRPDPAHPRAARFTSLVAQALPATTLHLTDNERIHVEALLFARLMTDAGELPVVGAADDVLDKWLAVTVFRSAGWTPTQRRAWWQVETLQLTADILALWTARQVIRASATEREARKAEIGGAVAHWLALAQEASALGEEIAAHLSFVVSENLLECVRAYGYRNALGTQHAARLGAPASPVKDHEQCRV